MELRHLRYFVAVAQEENVSRAALKLHVSQPALSRQVRDLEDELGFPLFTRSAKSVKLTEAGRVFLKEARAALQRVDDGITAARAVAESGASELHVGYATSPTVRMLPPTLRAFQAELPRVRVKLHDLSTEEMITGLNEGRLQLALMVRPGRGMLRGLRFEELGRDPIVVAVGQNHPLAARRAVQISDVVQQPLVALSRKEYPDYHEMLDGVFASTKIKPQIVEEHDSMSSLVAAVEAGSGVALVSESLECITGPRLKLVPLKPAPPPLEIGAAWAEELEPAAEAFLKCARRVGTGKN